MTYKINRGINLNAIWLLIILNLTVFLATTIYTPLIFMLGLQPATFLSRPWTLVTNLFVHGSLWHIFANMFTLYFFGNYLTRLIGERNFLIIYFLGGLLGNILYIFLAPSFSIGIGASGAIFALGGAMAVMKPNLRVFVFPIPAPIPLWVAVIGGFLILSFLPQVAWQAHLGGLLSGLTAGYFFKRRRH